MIHLSCEINRRESKMQTTCFLLVLVSILTSLATRCTLVNSASYSSISSSISNQQLIESPSAPSITPFAFTQYVEERQRASVLCTVPSGDLAGLTISWLKDGQLITPALAQAKNISIRLDSYESALKFAPVKLEHAGNYTCVARNRAGVASYSAPLQVFAEPRWSLKDPPKVGPLLAIRGQTIMIDCLTSGYPKPTQTWLIKNHTQSEFEPLAATGRISLAANGSLVIRNTDKSDEANYLCRSYNGIGKGFTWSTSLKVTVPAHFEWSGRQQVVAVRKQGQTQLRCDAFGDEPISIEWFRNKTRISNELTESGHSIHNQPIQNGLLSVLFIKNAQRSDNSLYECLTRNPAGRDRLPIELVVQEEPDLIGDLQTTNQVNSRSVTLAWTEPYDGRSPITEYMFQFMKVPNVMDQVMAVDSGVELMLDSDWQHAARLTFNASNAITPGAPNKLRSISIEPLEPSSRYLLRALAKNAFGQSKFSQPMEFSTTEEPPESVPLNVRAIAINSSSVQVSWDAELGSLAARSLPGRILGYYVGYRLANSPTNTSFLYKAYLINYFSATAQQQAYEQQRLEFIVNDLRRDTPYEFTVLAFNRRGSGPTSEFVVCKTVEMEAPKPVKVQVARESNESIIIEWQRDPSDQNPIDDYIIYQEKNSGSRESTQFRLPGNQSQHKVTGLKCGTPYQFYIVAQNKVGKSSPSEMLSASTSGSLPVVPTKMNLIKMFNSTCLQVNLNAFQDFGCRVRNFNVRYRVAKSSLAANNLNGAMNSGLGSSIVVSGNSNGLTNSAGLVASQQSLVLGAISPGGSSGHDAHSHALHKQQQGNSLSGNPSASPASIAATGNEWNIVRPKGVAANFGQWALDHEDRVEYLCGLDPVGEYNVHVSATNDVGRSEVEYTVLMSSDELRPSLMRDVLELLSSLPNVFAYVPSILVFLLVGLFLSLVSLILYTTVIKYYQKLVIMQNQMRATRRAKRDEKRRRKLNNARHSQKQHDLWADEYEEDDDDDDDDDDDGEIVDGDDEDDGDEDDGRLSGASNAALANQRKICQNFLSRPAGHYISNITNSAFDTSSIDDPASCNKFSGSTCTRSTASTDSIHGRFQCLSSKQYVKMNEYTMLPSISASLSPPSDIYGVTASGAQSQNASNSSNISSSHSNNNNNNNNNNVNNSLYYSTLRRSNMQTYLPQRQQINQSSQQQHPPQPLQAAQQHQRRRSQNQMADIYGYYMGPSQAVPHQSTNQSLNQSMQNATNEVANSIFVPPQQIIYSAPNIRRQPVFL